MTSGDRGRTISPITKSPIATLCVFVAMPPCLASAHAAPARFRVVGMVADVTLGSVFGLIFRIYLWCKPGTSGSNQYGGKLD